MGGPIDPNFVIDAAEALAGPSHRHIFEGKTKPSDYRIVRTLAKGGYGEVYIVERAGAVYAMKKVPKDLVRKNPNTTFFMNEKDVMTGAASEWIVRCHTCIQDKYFLYYIMDFIPGGDLMCYLSRVDVISEAEIKFYAAEIFMAITAMHEQGWIHRDLKPDNILIDSTGHIKLGDFGSCIKMTDGQAESSVTVGTPDYLSPDLLVTVGSSVRFGSEVDFWTVGVIIYEMLYGTTPFYAESLKETYHRISSISFTLAEPISLHLKDLIRGLLCPKGTRLDICAVKVHPFFHGIDWNNLRAMAPPHKPSIRDSSDVSNFVDTEFTPDSSRVECGYRDFVGFTYDPEHCASILRSMLDSDVVRRIGAEDDGCLRREEAACASMPVCCASPTGDMAGTASGLDDKYRELQDQIDRLDREREYKESLITARHKDLLEQMGRLEKEHEYKESLVAEYTQGLEKVLGQLRCKKEEHEALIDSIHRAKEDLANIRSDISEKLAVLDGLSTKKESEAAAAGHAPANSLEIQEGVKDVRKMFERAKFNEKLASIKKIAYWLHKENCGLRHELRARTVDVDIESRGVEELKKELRIKRTEIREYQQKMDQETAARKQLEDQLKALRLSIRSEVRLERARLFSVTNLMNNKEMAVRVEGDRILIEDAQAGGRGGAAREHPLNNIHIRGLRNNEMHHLSVKKRTLCVKIFFLGEVCRSSSSGARRSVKALEKDLEKEGKILQGLRSIMSVLSGTTLQDAVAQQRGSEKKIKQLQEEIERAKKSTITEFEVPDDENVAEFNNHLFYEQTVGKGTLCDHCNEVLYGVYNQAYICKDCLLVVHKTCYVLIDVSCELNRAMRAGTSLAVQCRSLEEKEAFVKLNKLY